MARIAAFCRTFISCFFEDLVLTRAASLAFATLLSIVPLIIFIFYVLSFFPALAQSGLQIENFVITHFVADSAQTILNQLHQFEIHVQHVSWINALALALVVLLLIFNIVDAVNGVWRAKMTRRSLLSLMLSWIVVIIAPIICAFLLLMSASLASLPVMLPFMQKTIVSRLLWVIFPLVLEWFTFSLFHWLMPSTRVYWRYAFLAGLFTTVLFEVAKWGFVLYFHYFSTYELIYGALAAIPIFFLWIYIAWLIIITCALMAHLLQHERSR